jgi:hypothetical protein
MSQSFLQRLTGRQIVRTEVLPSSVEGQKVETKFTVRKEVNLGKTCSSWQLGTKRSALQLLERYFLSWNQKTSKD